MFPLLWKRVTIVWCLRLIKWHQWIVENNCMLNSLFCMKRVWNTLGILSKIWLLLMFSVGHCNYGSTYHNNVCWSSHQMYASFHRKYKLGQTRYSNSLKPTLLMSVYSLFISGSWLLQRVFLKKEKNSSFNYLYFNNFAVTFHKKLQPMCCS